MIDWKRIAALVLLTLGVAVAQADSYRYPGPARIVAFADVHGAYEELVRLLRAAGVIDAGLNWSGGTAHLVSLGDIVDRGDDSRAVLDLLMRLQGQAEQAGGQVHVVLGNHEMMNLIGDLRYVAAGEYAAFAAEDPPGPREQAWQQFRTGYEDQGQAQLEFAAAFPPGYFAHREAFSSVGRYGQWLLQQPVLIVVGDTAFAHGGLPPLVADLGLEQLNERMRGELREFVVLSEALRAAGLIGPGEAAHDAALRIGQQLEAQEEQEWDAGLRERVQRFVALAGADVFDDDGPLWYRGSALCPVMLEATTVGQGLERLGARRIVVGHTPTPSRRVTTRHDGRVVLADTGMSAEHYNGTPAAVEIDADGDVRVIYADFGDLREPVAAPDGNAAGWVGGIPMLERFLATASVAGEREVEGRQLLTLADGALQTAAVRIPRRAAGKEQAAYRLDRLLGLGLVPVTVERGDGRRAEVVQWRSDDWIDERARAIGRQPVATWCAAGNIFDLQYAFDTLTANNGRDASNMHYSEGISKLWLSDFATAFGNGTGLPDYLRNRSDVLSLSPELAARLARLDAATIERELGAWLNARARAALLARRDEMLATWPRTDDGS